MKLSACIFTALLVIAGLVAPTPAEAAPAAASKKNTKKIKQKKKKEKKGQKAHKKKNQKGKSAHTAAALALLDEPLLTEEELKKAPDELRKLARIKLTKLGIIPIVYEDAAIQAVFDGSTSILQALLLAGLEQDSLNKAFDAALNHVAMVHVQNDQRHISAKMLLEAGAYKQTGLTPQLLAHCRNREVDTLVRSNPNFKPDDTLAGAVMTGDIEAARKKIAEGANVLPVINNKLPLIFVPIIRDDHEMLKVLVPAIYETSKKKAHGKVASIADVYEGLVGETALINAHNCLRLILNEGKITDVSPTLQNITTPEKLSRPPLQKSTMQLLTSFPCDEAIKPQVLDYLLLYGFSEGINSICQRDSGAPMGISPLIPVIAADNAEELQKLLKKDKNTLNSIIWTHARAEHTPLSLAAVLGSSKCVKLLLEQKNIDINKAVRNAHYPIKIAPLALAALNQHTDCAKLLMEAPDLNMEDNATLAMLCLSNNRELIKLYLQKPGLNINSCASIPTPALNFCIDIPLLTSTLVLLNQKGIELAPPESATSALHSAAIAANTVALQAMLTRHDAAPNMTDKEQRTPLNLLTTKSGFISPAATIGRDMEAMKQKSIQILKETGGKE